MRKHILPLLIIVSIIFCFSSCRPDSGPTKPEPDITKPEPKPEPEPEPEPEPGPGPSEEAVIYYDNLDKVKSTSNNNYFNTWTAFRNMEGSGIASVTYDGFYTSVRSTFVSKDYPGASGVNGVYFSKEGAWMAVNGIGLPSDKRTYKFTVGLCAYNKDVVPNKTFKITISDEHNKKNYDLDYSAQKYGQYWYLATSVFEVSSTETTKLNIKIISAQIDRELGSSENS